MKKINSLSIVLPCYNEENNIGQLVEICLDFLPSIANDFEIIVVNDGSTDNSLQVLQQFDNKIKIINQDNQGYGAALKAGFKNVTKEWIFFTDSDLQFDITELRNFIRFTSDYNFIFGYRIKRADNFVRKLIALLLKIWNKILLDFPLSYKDIDCAFKLMHTQNFKEIRELESSGAMINTELILRILNKGYKIKQIGVLHYPRVEGSSTGNNLKVILKAIIETFKLKNIK